MLIVIGDSKMGPEKYALMSLEVINIQCADFRTHNRIKPLI